MPCVACGNPALRVDEHIARTIEGSDGEPARRLRVVRARCPRCGTRRDVYFRIGTALPS